MLKKIAALHTAMGSSSKSMAGGVDCVGAVELDGLGQGDPERFKKLLAGCLLAIHTRHLFDPPDPGAGAGAARSARPHRPGRTGQPERQRRELGTAAIAILVVSGALLLLGMALAAMVAAALASGGFGQ